MMADDKAVSRLLHHRSDDVDPYHSDDGRFWETDGIVLGGMRMPKRWQFLHSWFELLEFRVTLAEPERLDAHDVRIGRECPEDWFIEINLAADAHPHEEYDTLAENRVKRFRTIREAIVLLSIFAHVDYDAWLVELARTTRFKPPMFMDITMHKLRCKWAFRFGGRDHVSMCQWTTLRDLFGFKTLSKDFKTDFARASALALEQGFDVRSMEPIPLQLHFALQPQNTSASQIKVARGITQTIKEILAIEAEHAANRRDTSFRGHPVFHVERLDVDFQSYDLRTSIVSEIQQLVETAGHVHTLSLPTFFPAYEKREDAATWLQVLGPLFQAITGCASTPGSGGVRRLIVPMNDYQGVFLQPLMSALASATSVEYVRFEFPIYHIPDKELKWQVWAWLGFALLSDASTSSVTSLEIARCRLTDRCVHELRRATEAANPVTHLWRVCTEETSASSSFPEPRSSKSVTVMKGSTVLHLGCGATPVHFEATSDIQGVLVPREDADSTVTSVNVILPGYGLCRVDKSALKRKRHRVSHDEPHVADAPVAVHPSGLRTFIVDFIGKSGRSSPAKKFIVDLLDLVGSSLTSLAIRADDVEDELLNAGLRLCPRIENLRLDGLAIQTMEPLLSAYRDGMKIRSLDLRALKLPAAAMESFLEAVGNDVAVVSHLDKLRFGSHWSTFFGDDTRCVCERMLTTNKRLQHVHAYQQGYGTFGIYGFHRNPLVGCSSSHFAFLSVLRHLQRRVRRPSQESIARIFQFAATERRFMVEEHEFAQPAHGRLWGRA